MSLSAEVQSFSGSHSLGIRSQMFRAAGKAGNPMNTLLWIVQIVLAGVFLFTGFSKIFAYGQVVKMMETKSKAGRIGVSRGQAVLVGLLEIAGAVGLLAPMDPWPPYILLRLAAGGLALLMVAAGIFHIRRKESAAPSVALFLLALFVIVGRWPR
jgi:uncharacterized membrane protein YphA (DoxX/SURF4 family)